jgi:hypothetical protein
MTVRRHVAVLAVAAALVPGLVACTGSDSAPARPSGSPVPSTSTSATSSRIAATRWWSNGAVTEGSTIDPKNPTAARSRLQPSRGEYCAMLKQTVAAGKSILPGATADDPALLTSTKAFVAELEAVAPSSLTGPWKVLGGAVLTLVGSGGDTAKVKGIDAAAVRRSATTVAADAKHSCGVDLSRVSS